MATRARESRSRKTQPPPLAFEGLIVHPAQPARQPVATARRLAALCEATLGGKWRGRALGRRATDFLIEPARRRRVTPGAAWDMVAKLRALREVRDAEPAFTLPGLPESPREAVKVAGVRLTSAALAPEKHLRESDDCEWSIRMCRAPEAWALSASMPNAAAQGVGIIVAHPDTGYTTHPAIFDVLRLRTRDGYDFHEYVRDPSDPLVGKSPGHGTSTASVIMSGAGRAGGRGAFVCGIAPRASLVPLRISDSVVHYSYARLCEALYYAVEKKCHVVSMSLGGPWGSAALARAIRYAVDNGLILISASGNYWPWVVYPAKYDEVLAIAACDARGRIWKHAATGEAVDATAPGESVWRAWAKGLGDYEVARSSGTSYATATTAGACALWLAHHGHAMLVKRYGAARLPGVFHEVLKKGGVRKPAGWKTHEWGAGIVDARNLLAAPLPAATRTARKRKLRARPAPGVTNDLAAIAAYFPKASPARVQRALLRLFGIDPHALQAVLAECGNELRFHLATDAALREALLSTAATRAAARRRPAPPRKLLAGASKALRERLARN